MARVETETREQVNAFQINRYGVAGERVDLWPDLVSLRTELEVRLKALEQQRMAEVGGVTLREMFWRKGEFYFWDGKDWQTYDQILENSLSHYSQGKVRERFEAEKEGWRRAGLLAEQMEVGQVIVIGSPPDDIYRDKTGQGLTANFILVKLSPNKWLAYSVYVPEISLQEHRRLLGINEELNANGVVATPVVMEGELIDKLVVNLGFDGWQEIVRRAVDLDKVAKGTETGLRKELEEAIVSLWQSHAHISNEVFWLVFSDMISDFLIKDIKGRLSSDVEGLRKSGLIFLLEQLKKRNEWELAARLRWELAVLQVDDAMIETWLEEQRSIMEQRWYQVIFGGAHGSGAFSFGQNELRFTDWRERWRIAEAKQEKQIECKKCHHQFVVMGEKKVRCPHCGAVIEVS